MTGVPFDYYITQWLLQRQDYYDEPRMVIKKHLLADKRLFFL
jgi:hypothetical protein